MARRRANGEGTIYRSRKKWIAAITIGRLPNGALRRRRKTATSRAEAAEYLREMLNARGKYAEPRRLTLGQFLTEWLRGVVRHDREPNTYASYRRAVTNHVLPHLRLVKLRELAPVDVQTWLSALAGAGVGGRTRENAYIVLHTAINHAVALKLIPDNPVGAVERPKYERGEIWPFTKEQVDVILDETASLRTHALYTLAFLTGMRQAELFGLQWEYVDLPAGTLRVEKQLIDVDGTVELRRPKTKTSIRTLELPGRVVNALRDHQAVLLKEGHAGAPLVFPGRRGAFRRRSNFARREWNPLLNLLDIPHRGFHHVRHTYATLALSAGDPVHVVSRTLGHAKASTTLNIYGHFVKANQSQARETMERLFG